MNITRIPASIIRRRAPRVASPHRPVDAGLMPRPLG
jgi:hypothetical protein